MFIYWLRACNSWAVAGTGRNRMLNAKEIFEKYSCSWSRQRWDSLEAETHVRCGVFSISFTSAIASKVINFQFSDLADWWSFVILHSTLYPRSVPVPPTAFLATRPPAPLCVFAINYSLFLTVSKPIKHPHTRTPPLHGHTIPFPSRPRALANILRIFSQLYALWSLVL